MPSAALQISTAAHKIDDANFQKIMYDYIAGIHDHNVAKKSI